MTIFQYADPYVAGNYSTLEIDDADLSTYESQGWVTTPPPDYVSGALKTIYQPAPLPDNWDVAPGTPQSMDIPEDQWPTFQAAGWVDVDPYDGTVPSFLFNDTDLTSDDFLTMWESKMPALAVKMKVYNGKRFLAKNFIRKTLLKQGIDVESLSNPSTELKDAATDR